VRAAGMEATSLRPLRGALDELDHAFAGASYVAKRATCEVRSQVEYPDRAPSSAPLETPAQPQSDRPTAGSGVHKAGKKRTHAAVPAWVDLDGSGAGDPAVAAALRAVRKKGRAAAPLATADSALGMEEGSDFEALLRKHRGEQQQHGGARRASHSPAQRTLTLTPAGEPVDAATTNVAVLVAKRLNESMDEVVATIERTLVTLGTQKVLELVERAERTEADGGMLTCDGTRRRRTMGGVFFYLVKQLATRKEKVYIWPDHHEAAAGGGGGATMAAGGDSAGGAQTSENRHRRKHHAAVRQGGASASKRHNLHLQHHTSHRDARHEPTSREFNGRRPSGW